MIWIAPAEGLYLKSVNYDDYNKKDSIFESLELDEQEVILPFRRSKLKILETKKFSHLL